MGINWKKWGKVALGVIETAFDVGANYFTGGTYSKIKDYAKKGLKLGKFTTGTFKDYLDGGDIDLSGLSSDIGDLKNGLADALLKAQIETQGKELHGKIYVVKSELQNQLNQQGAKNSTKIHFSYS